MSDTNFASGEVSVPVPGPSAAAKPGPEPAPVPALPPLTPAQFRVYNRLAEQMEYFHDHFRKSWNTLYHACESGRRPAGMSLKQFIDEGLHLCTYLTAHHNIEETHLYPILGRKMPAFRSSAPGPPPPSRLFKGVGAQGKRGKEANELLRQHEAIHEGMDVFEAYLRECRGRERELELGVLKEKMDTWGEVLLKHLDQEVRDLSAETMRMYYTLEEMRAIPI